MGKPFQHINYSFEDIERYLQGKMSPADMHAMEKAALQDPFLAEAIEGYETSGLETAASDLADIHNRLNGHPETKVVPLPAGQHWWKIAAVVILIAGAATLGWRLLSDIPVTEQAKQLTQSTTAPEKPTVQPGSDGSVSLNSSKGIEERKTPPDAGSNNKNNKDIAANLAPVTRKTRIAAVDQTQVEPNAPNTLPVVTGSVATGRTKQEAKGSALNGELARVSQLDAIDPPGKPLFTYSSKDGLKKDTLMKLTAAVDLRNQKGYLSNLQVSAANPVTGKSRNENFTATGTLTANLALSPVSNTLDEVVVVGYGTTTKRSVSGAVVKQQNSSDYKTFNRGLNLNIDSLPLYPEGGWENFNEELRSIIRKAQKELPAVSGKIELKIELNSNGKAEDVSVLRSFDASVNDLVIKAVKKHRRWYLLTKDKGQPVTVVIQL